jgi:DNA-directed RNA polymerase specialized sigma24 family protein
VAVDVETARVGGRDRRLIEAEAELILATEIEGVSRAEVAERFGVSYNAVKIRRQRA